MICLSIFSVFRFTSVDRDELVSHSGGGSVGASEHAVVFFCFFVCFVYTCTLKFCFC